MPSFFISSGSKKKEPRCACLSEAKASHSHKMWTEVSSSVHFLRIGSLHNPMKCKCLLKVLCPVSRPITALDCVLLKDNSRAPTAGSGSEINSRACLCILQGARHNARCVKGIVDPIIGHEGPEAMYTQLYPFLTLPICGVGVKNQAAAALPPRKETWYPLYRGWLGPRDDLDECG